MKFSGGDDASPLNDWIKDMNGLNKSAVAGSVFAALLCGCVTQEAVPPAPTSRPESPGDKPQQQLQFQLASGTYRCEAGEKLEIRRIERNTSRIELKWHGNSYALQRYDSSSGLPRYEDRQNGLLWIDLPWKSVLMDAKSGRPLANECKAASS